MFVLEALLLTFMTTPLVRFLYPPELRSHFPSNGVFPPPMRKERPGAEEGVDEKQLSEDFPLRTRFTVVLDKIDHMPGIMAITQLIQPPVYDGDTTILDSDRTLQGGSQVSLDAFRLIELADRTSDVMKSSAPEILVQNDSMINIYKMFGELHDMPVSPSLSVVPFDDMASKVSDHAQSNVSHFIIVPWTWSSHAQSKSPAETVPDLGATTPGRSYIINPFDALFGTAPGIAGDKLNSAVHSHFVRGVFSQAKTDVALFVDRGSIPGECKTGGNAPHIYVPFFGGPDDRLALEFVVQLCMNPRVSATVVRITKTESETNLADVDEADERAINAAIETHGLSVMSVCRRPIGFFISI